MGKIKNFINRVEENDIGFGLWLSAAFCVIFARDFLENALSFNAVPRINSFHFLHFPVFFISMLLAVIILLHIFSKTEIAKVSRIGLIFFALIIVPMPVDYLISRFTGEDISYLYIIDNVPKNFAVFLNPLVKIGSIPYGIRLEIALVMLLSMLYIFVKRRNIFVSLAGGCAVFLVCFFYISIPALLIAGSKFLSALLPALKLDPPTLTEIFTEGDLAQRRVSIIELVLAVFLAAVWFWRYSPEKFKALLGNLRFSRLAHYCMMVALGIGFSFFIMLDMPAEHFLLIRIIGIMCALFFAFQFSVVTNDICDIECDKVSNCRRPLASGAMDTAGFLKAGMAYLAFALLFAFYVSDACFMLTLFFIVMYFLYSIPPFRLKRFFPVAPCIIGVQALVAFLLGYASCSQGDVGFFVQAPVLWLIFLVFSLSANVKDLKDIQGDKICAIPTLPVMLGEEKARRTIGFLVFLSYLLVPIFLNRVLNVPPILYIFALVFGLKSYFHLARKDSGERPIFYFYFIYALLLLIFLERSRIIIIPLPLIK